MKFCNLILSKNASGILLVTTQLSEGRFYHKETLQYHTFTGKNNQRDRTQTAEST